MERVFYYIMAVVLSFTLTDSQALGAECGSGKDMLLFETESNPDDAVPPGSVEIIGGSVTRGEDTSGTLCVSTGTVVIEIVPAEDDVYDSYNVGYLVEIEDDHGNHFGIFCEQDDPCMVQERDGLIWFNFFDRPDERFDVEYRVSAVDRAGNVSGESDTIRLTDEGIDVGCSTSSSSESAGFLLFLLAAGLALSSLRNK